MTMTIHRPAVRIACVLAGWLAVFASAASADTTSNAADASQPASLPKTTSSQPVYRELKWDELMPKDWDPLKRLKGARLDASDDSAASRALMREMRQSWDEAPLRFELHGAHVRLPGYVVPLDEANGGLKSFLLVPYFGACIHVPPPPANQIVLAVSATPLKLRTMQAVWAKGTLSTSRSASPMGVSGYRMEVDAVEPYVAPDTK